MNGMSEKILINGYFRSGTSAVWENVKNSNKDSIVYYEPCHPSLPSLIAKAEEDPLHNKRLWSEYAGLDNFIISNHPYLGRSPYGVRVGRYASRLESLAHAKELRIVLQSNRWHFEIENFLNAGYQVYHIVRRSEAVFDSMCSAYTAYDQSEIYKKLKKVALKLGAVRNFWELNELMDYLRSVNNYGALNQRFYSKSLMGLEQKFVVAWTLVNFVAIKMLGEHPAGVLLSYEKLSDDVYASNKFLQAGLKWQNGYFKKPSLESDSGRHRRIACDLGLLEQYDYVSKSLS